MCSIIRLGAFKHNTNEYIHPSLANKTDKYVCPNCNEDVMFKKGLIKIPHFAHYKDNDNKCDYYNNPCESQIHKDAKFLLQFLLQNNYNITIYRECINCNNTKNFIINNNEVINKEIITEYRFNYQGLKIADVAYIENKTLKYIFEIYNKHKTIETIETSRPEPWFEINTTDLLNIDLDIDLDINSNNLEHNNLEHNNSTDFKVGIIKIKCIRQILCDKCNIVKCYRCHITFSKCMLKTNINNKLCKDCDIKWCPMIFLDVSFSEKEQIKSYGARFDIFYKKWYITNFYKNKQEILSKWNIWQPYPCDFTSSEVIFLDVNYDEKATIKSYDGKWDKVFMKWYILNDNKDKLDILKIWSVWNPY